MAITTEEEYLRAKERLRLLKGPSRIKGQTLGTQEAIDELSDEIEDYEDQKLIAELANDPEWQELMKQL